MPTQLNACQRHAVALRADCKPITDVAQDCGVCEKTVHRWKKIHEFQAAVIRAARRRMKNAGRANDRRAAKVIEAAMLAQRELHAYIRHEKELPFQRVLDLRRIMEDGARMLDRIRFSPKAKNRGELLLFMRQNVNSAVAFANHCENEDNKNAESAQTPQNPLISGHAPRERQSPNLLIGQRRTDFPMR